MSAEFDLKSVEEEIVETRFKGKVHHFSRVESTNDLALDAAQAGAEWGAWIADEQTAGRGRGGHGWHSAPGDGIYLSALVAPGVPTGYGSRLPLAAGLAVQTAVREYTGLVLDLRWPNDLMFGERKCGGILVESASKPSSAGGATQAVLRYAVIGIGLNVNHAEFPQELRHVATSLRQEGCRSFAREPLLAAVLRNLDQEVERVRRGWLGTEEGPDVLRRFAGASTWVSGKRVTVGEEGGYTGTTRGLDELGFLRVEDDRGEMRTVLSGGVRSA